MEFEQALQQGIFLRRYKRFLVDMVNAQGELITVHCPNTGSMKNCLAPDTPCWYSQATNVKRKYPHTLEIVTTLAGHLAGINTLRANALVAEGVSNGLITQLQGYDTCRAEVVYGLENSRADFVLEAANRAKCVVEVKNVTLLDAGQGYFPDAISLRGSKHLRELIHVVSNGERAVLIFCVQHQGITSVAPAEHIDAAYAKLCGQARQAGVEFYAFQATLSPDGIKLCREIPVLL